MNTTLKFFSAKAIKTLPMWDCGPVQAGGDMFVAKWNDLFVLARNERNFWVVSAEDAAKSVKTVRDAAGKPVVSHKAPRIVPVGGQFEWKVECGSTCTDGCCGDDAPTFEKVCASKEEALALGAQMKKQYNHPTEFVRVRGPAFYSYTRIPV